MVFKGEADRLYNKYTTYKRVVVEGYKNKGCFIEFHCVWEK